MAESTLPPSSGKQSQDELRAWAVSPVGQAVPGAGEGGGGAWEHLLPGDSLSPCLEKLLSLECPLPGDRGRGAEAPHSFGRVPGSQVIYGA